MKDIKKFRLKVEFMKIVPKNKKCVVEMIEEDEDLINLVDGDTYFRVWRDGEFEVDQLPPTQKDGSIILPTDSLLRVTDEVETNIDISIENEEEWDKFWETHSVSHYIIKDGFDVEE